MTPRDIEIGARTLYGEARGESFQGRVAVAHVIMNRVLADLRGDNKPDWWGEGIEAVCLRAFQFSCWNANDPNRMTIERVTVDDPAFLECTGIMALVAAARLGRKTIAGALANDPTFGSTHYKVTSLPWPKDWGEPRTSVCSIGWHSFYNDIEPGYRA